MTSLSSSSSAMTKVMMMLAFLSATACTTTAFSLGGGVSTTSRRSASKTSSYLSAMTTNDNDTPTSDYPELNWNDYEQKNISRKKFGLNALTPEQYMELQSQVQQLELEQAQKAATMSAAAAELSRTNNDQQQQEQQPGFLQKLFANAMPDTCESSWDCPAPGEHCCDFGFQKICCKSGKKSPVGDLALVPVPVDTFMPGESQF